jgi:hypothetical protein
MNKASTENGWFEGFVGSGKLCWTGFLDTDKEIKRTHLL